MIRDIICRLAGVQSSSVDQNVRRAKCTRNPRDCCVQCVTICHISVNGDVTVRTRPQGGAGAGSNSLVGAIKSLIGK